MEINGIVLSPDPRLRQECAEVEEVNADLRALVEWMKVQMFENGGCGLAAPQVGETIQLAIVDTEYTSEKDYDPYVLINPVIVGQSDNLVPFNEGCLSIPGINCEIRRPDHVVVEAYSLEGECVRYEASGDLFCVCLQHEIDHLHGKTMFERLLPQQRVHAMKQYQEALARGAKPVRYEASGDLFCVCLQHEIDHLHGKTMFERLLPQQRVHAMKQYQEALARGAKPGETE